MLWGTSHEEIFENIFYKCVLVCILIKKTINNYIIVAPICQGDRGHNMLVEKTFENMVLFGTFWCIL